MSGGARRQAGGLMADEKDLRPATAEEVASALAYALRFDKRGRPWPAGMEIAAGVAATMLAEGIAAQGVVVMKARGSKPRAL